MPRKREHKFREVRGGGFTVTVDDYVAKHARLGHEELETLFNFGLGEVKGIQKVPCCLLFNLILLVKENLTLKTAE